MIKVPEELKDYVDFTEGKIIAVNLPDELQKDFELFKYKYEELQNKYKLSDL